MNEPTQYPVGRWDVVGRLNQQWLEGDPSWWPKSKGSLIIEHDHETKPPDSWSSWRRQRLRPPGPAMLVPIAWTAFFLAAASFPLIFPGRTSDDQLIASALFGIGWTLTIAPLAFTGAIGNHPARKSVFDIYPIDTKSILIGLIFFAAHVFINTLFGWLAYLFFWIAWVRTVVAISEAVEPSCGRWLLPVTAEAYAASMVAEGWQKKERRFGTDCLVVGPEVGDSKIIIEGVRHHTGTYLAVSLLGRSGYRYDPFQTRLHNPIPANMLHEPPIEIANLKWENDDF